MINSKEITKALDKGDLTFSHMIKDGHEQIVFCNDNQSKLRAIIAIHSTILGPSLGGCRMWNYNNEREALNDVLRLSRGMSLKASISGLNLGGGKAVIIGDATKDKTEMLLQKFGEFVDSLGGRYITAEDVGMTAQDMDIINLKTKFVTGISSSKGGSDDPSPVTAYGVYMGIKAASKFKWGSDVLAEKKIVVQGVGKVGQTLVKYLIKDGAKVFVNDINEINLLHVLNKFDVTKINDDEVFSMDSDIYAPCALGASLNSKNIKKLSCSIVAGAANNQLENEIIHGEMLMHKGIIYAPDFLINAGGLINVYSELNRYNRSEALSKTEEIYNITLEILSESDRKKTTPHLAALEIAKKRMINKIIA